MRQYNTKSMTERNLGIQERCPNCFPSQNSVNLTQKESGEVETKVLFKCWANGLNIHRLLWAVQADFHYVIDWLSSGRNRINSNCFSRSSFAQKLFSSLKRRYLDMWQTKSKILISLILFDLFHFFLSCIIWIVIHSVDLLSHRTSMSSQLESKSRYRVHALHICEDVQKTTFFKTLLQSREWWHYQCQEEKTAEFLTHYREDHKLDMIPNQSKVCICMSRITFYAWGGVILFQ
jgi:hypothetical protein